MSDLEIFVPFNTPSLKNSKVKTSKGIFMSKTTRKYLTALGVASYSSRDKEVKDYKTKPNLFKTAFTMWTKPDSQIEIGFHFVRGTKHNMDFGNMCQIVLDLMTAHDFIEDDSMKWIVPRAYKKNDLFFSYSKENPGVFIKIILEQ